MAYGTFSGVMNLLPDQVATQISESSRPSYTTVTGWLTDVSYQLDAALDSVGVATSSLTTAQTAALRIGNEKEVAYMIMLVRSGVSGERADAMWQSYHKDFMALLADIGKGDWTASVETTTLPTSYTMDSPSDTDDSLNPIFERDAVY